MHRVCGQLDEPRMERHQWRHEAERVAHERHTPRGHLAQAAREAEPDGQRGRT